MVTVTVKNCAVSHWLVWEYTLCWKC